MTDKQVALIALRKQNILDEVCRQRDELLAALELARAGFSQAASGRISQKYLEEHFEAVSSAIARVKGV